MRGFMHGHPRRLPFGRIAPGFTAAALLIAAILAPASFAAAPIPVPGTAVVDGNASEWTAADFFANMTDNGDPDNDPLATLSLRYDCETETLYALVAALGDGKLSADRPDQAYLRIDGSGKIVSGDSGNDGTPPDFAWVGSDGTLADGFEASASLAPGTYTIRAHVLFPFDDSDGYLTLDTVPRDAPLTIECPEPTPTPTPEVTPTPTPVVTPTPTPEVTPTPTPTGSEEPTETPNVTPTPTPEVTPTPTPTGSEGPTEDPNVTPTPTPTGGVGGATGTPSVTLPPTDTLASSGGNTPSDGLRMAFLLMAGLMATLALVTPAWARRHIRRG